MKNVKSTLATIGGYITAIYNALFVLDIDNLDYHLPSTYLKLFGAVVLPILAGHATQLKENSKNV